MSRMKQHYEMTCYSGQPITQFKAPKPRQIIKRFPTSDLVPPVKNRNSIVFDIATIWEESDMEFFSEKLPSQSDIDEIMLRDPSATLQDIAWHFAK